MGSDRVESIWKHALHVGAAVGAGAQAAHDALAQPFLYHGDAAADSARAADLYERFFDVPIQKAERETIVAALQATYERSDREAGLVDAGERKVHLDAQEVSVA